MRTPCHSFRSLRDAIEHGGVPSGDLIGAEHHTAFGDLLQGTAIPRGIEDLAGRSVVVASTDPFITAMALIELDGMVKRMVLCPPDLAVEHLPYVMQSAEVDTVVSDGSFFNGAAIGSVPHVRCAPALVPRIPSSHAHLTTEWILLTSGTTGRPKLVLHTLASLTGAISANNPNSNVTWSTFYDIRRYGGLQIYLRAVLTGSSLVLSGSREPLANFLHRAEAARVTHISGTPSHWRRALMSPAAEIIKPRYIRLSGEIADQAILNNLRSFYPDTEISHAFATTEAGVAFDVRDGLTGFPSSLLTDTPGVELKVVAETLRVRSSRTADRYLGENPPALKDSDGFVDTGDVLEQRDGRCYFHGRRDGVINVGGLKVHPEEVEAVLNRHPQVHLSLVKKKKSPITGALVVADVQLKETPTPAGEQALELLRDIQKFCRQSLAPHKVPTAIRLVSTLAISATGKLVRHHA